MGTLDVSRGGEGIVERVIKRNFGCVSGGEKKMNMWDRESGSRGAAWAQEADNRFLIPFSFFNPFHYFFGF